MWAVVLSCRSSAFHTKPAKDSAQLRVGALRVLLYPAFYHWWREQVRHRDHTNVAL
jgi:hypothetical protein